VVNAVVKILIIIRNAVVKNGEVAGTVFKDICHEFQE
jgi:hypothetical protein